MCYKLVQIILEQYLPVSGQVTFCQRRDPDCQCASAGLLQQQFQHQITFVSHQEIR